MSQTERWQVRGQPAAVNMMQGAVRSGRVAHAYLFAGPRGVGKATAARAFARALVCEAESPEERPCGRCPACVDAAAGRHVDVHVVAPEEDKLLIGQVRRMHQLALLRAVRGRRKVFIVEAIDTATPEAQNALLKVLEEPPGETVFILIAHNETPPLPTVVSRCVTVRFGRLPREVAAAILRERFGYGDAAELGAARLAGLQLDRVGGDGAAAHAVVAVRRGPLRAVAARGGRGHYARAGRLRRRGGAGRSAGRRQRRAGHPPFHRGDLRTAGRGAG